MARACNHLTVALALMSFGLVALSRAEPTFLVASDENICHLLPEGTIIRQPGSCYDAVQCVAGELIPNQSCTRPQFFLLTKKCGTTTDKYCSSPCAKSSAGFIADPNNCNGWYECNGSTVLSSGVCPGSSVFDAKQKICTDPSELCTATYTLCMVVPSGVSIKDEHNCHMYYQCTSKQVLESKTCADGLYYEASSGKCVPKAQVNCHKHPVPAGACGSDKVPVRGQFVSDQATCRGYFFCRDLGAGVADTEPVWGQCDEERFFDSALESCVSRRRVTCSEDRCDGRQSGYELSDTPGCQHYLECADGVTVKEHECPSGEYFNADAQQCQAAKVAYAACSS